MKGNRKEWKVVFETNEMERYFQAQNLLRANLIGYETKMQTSVFRSNLFRFGGHRGDAYQLAVRSDDVERAMEVLSSL